MTPNAIYLKDYSPPDFHIDSVELHIDLSPENTVVTSRLSMRRSVGTVHQALVLDGQALTLKTIALDGRPLEPQEFTLDPEHLIIHQVPDIFVLTTQTVTQPSQNTALEGLYMSNGVFCTQCEAEGFRRITYFLDRPDVMASYTATLTADKQAYPVLLANGNLIAAGDADNGRHWATWHDPFKKPCYLFALVAGELAYIEDFFTTASARRVTLRIYTSAANLNKCDHAMLALKQAMRWDEEAFGREYDLDILMLVAIDDFNMGAMENKGLNIFNSSCILVRPDTATDSDYERVQSIIGHEYFHNWTGNRITCRDWFQLSLKEGLTVFRDQEFSASMVSKAVKRIADVRALRTHQFAEDSGPMAHPVRPDSYIEINNFYTMTVYNKGAELIRMMQTLLGVDGFRRGMDLYFERHDGQAVTTDDFVCSMEDANGVDFSQFRRWYTQAGTPLVRVSGEYNESARTYQLRMKQSCLPTPGQPEKAPLHIPIELSLLAANGRALPLQLADETASVGETRVLELRSADETVCFVNVPERPIPSLLRKFSAPVKLDADYSDDDLAFLLAHDSDEFNRWDAGQQLAVRVLFTLMADVQANRTLSISNSFFDAFKRTLTKPETDKLFVAHSLTLPSEAYLAELLVQINIDALLAARHYACAAIAQHFRTDLLEVYESNRSSEPYAYNATAMGKRGLKNLCLYYLMHVDDAAVRKMCVAQANHADNMTDAISALAALVNANCSERDEALAQFYHTWQHDSLVMDKWLSLQANSQAEDALERVKALIEQPVFDFRKPNKVRALIGGFCFGNLRGFHKANGEGYEFLAEQVLRLDPINPQIAARLLSALSHWRKFDTARQALMTAQIERIVRSPSLSKDSFEIASKTLSS